MIPTLKELFDWIEAGPHNNPTHFEICRRKSMVISWNARDWPRPLLEQLSYQQLLDLSQLTMCHMYGRWRIETTPRQKEQHKLASQLRSITGMIGLARHLRMTGNGMVFSHLDRVTNDLAEVEKSIRHLMKNISQRIPSNNTSLS